ncbi:hypothetical protein LS81_010665 [Helicobacter trogontum]|uniref:Uncharacterized protein n=2 Tax=Helicobacter trogontum TaxID=50960 RepID=A0A4U8S1B0_9HELI|nr:hypothetical protein [Helicobacter trogontum]TLD79346.1 hypothetical protein LS81_010665 [Helicobacter trogontum]
MRYKILTHTQSYLFLELSDEICKLMKNHQKTPYNLEFELFLQIPNLTKVDILEYFEESILDLATGYSGNGIELDSLFFEFLFDNTNVMADNSANPTYISEYINIVGQLFLGGYIDFGLCGLQDKEENLLSRQRDKYQAWIHFRDNFFYTDAYYRDITEVREKYPNMSDDEYIYSNWDTPQYWDSYRFWVARTPKGDEYFEKVLAPRFYEKYKDLEVEIDDKGNIVHWIGQINR